jgi:hypothetical protein
MRRLVILGYWGNEDTKRALDMVREALAYYPFGEDMDRIIYFMEINGVNPHSLNPRFRASPTLVMCYSDGLLEDDVLNSITMASGIDQIEHWCNRRKEGNGND